MNNTNRVKQNGSAAMIGTVVLSVVLLAVIIVGFFMLRSNQDENPKSPATNTKVEVSADDSLTEGKTNAELATDVRIVGKALERDEDQRLAAEKILADKALPVGDGVTSSTTVAVERLSNLQTEFISEVDRRLKVLDESEKAASKLTSEQRAEAIKLINDETAKLTALKSKVASDTTKEVFLIDRDALDKEYTNYLLSAAKVRLLLWANDQAVLDEKVNVLGGKFQERLNDASDMGKSIAKPQTALNTYQTDKTLARDATAKATQSILAAQPDKYEANRAILKDYYNQLATAHDHLDRAHAAAKEIASAIFAFKDES